MDVGGSFLRRQLVELCLVMGVEVVEGDRATTAYLKFNEVRDLIGAFWGSVGHFVDVDLELGWGVLLE